MPCLKRYTLLLLFFTWVGQCYAQTGKIDRLFAQLHQSATKQERLNSLLALCEEYQSLNRDTLFNLAQEAQQLAITFADKEKKGLAAMALSDAYMQWGWSDSALAALEPVLRNEKDYTPAVYFKMQRHHGMIYTAHAEYEKALSILYPALTGAEKWKDTLNTAAIMNSIGSITMAMQKPEEALVWIKKAAASCTGNPNCNTILAAIYTNAANIYHVKGNADSSEYYIQQAIPLCRQAENLFVLATALRINASLLTNKKRFPEAEAALKEMMAIRKAADREGLFVDDNLKLAEFYAQSGQLEKAINLCKNILGKKEKGDTAILQGSTVTDPKLKLEYWQALATYCKQANRLGEYQEALEQIVVLKDSVYEASYAPAIADAETKYQVQKKENTILQQKYSLQRSRILLYGLLALLTMSFVIAYFILRDNRRKQKIKMELAMADERVKASAAVKVAEEKERVRIAADLHDNIGAYASAIKSDVEKMAANTTTTASPQLESLQHHSQEIINSLRDTIWVLNKEHITITGISDRIKNYISKLQASYEQVQFNISETIIDDIRINSPTALNIFRIVQEAVHNAMKHSGATQVNIAITSTDGVMVSIMDNGQGMDIALQSGKGNGLINMRVRAAEAGLQLTVESTINEGTTVAMRLPTIN